MSELTVLVSPTPLYPKQNPLGFNFARRGQNDLTRPVMITLENVDTDEDGPRSPVEVSNLNAAFLSPPRRTFRASRPSPPERSASAPPLTVLPTSSEESLYTQPIADVPGRVFSPSAPTDRSELSRPPPPLFRPTTFWRRTKRSGVAGASYSPSSHLIRRSTFIAAGLSLDKPEADLSALGVESRESMAYVRSLGTGSTDISSIALHGSTRPGAANQYRSNQAVQVAHTTAYDHSSPHYTAGTAPTFTPDANAAIGVEDVVLFTDHRAASLIQVTALPPATKSPQAVLPKLPYHHQLNILYLIPLFIALGVVLGAITAVIILKWRENRRRLLCTSLLPGPPYVSPENDMEDRLLVHGYPSMEQVSLFAAATPSKYTVHGTRFTPERTLAWKILDTTQPPSSRPPRTQTIISSVDGERFTVVTEEDPFLAASPTAAGRSPTSTNDVPLLQIRVSPSLPDPTPGDKSGKAKANLLKPFRRSMFDILRLKSPYRPVPSVCKEYVVDTPDEEPVDKTPKNRVRGANSSRNTLAGDSPSCARLSLGDDLNTGDMKDALGLLGSREGQGLADIPGVSPKQALRIKEGTLSSSTQSEKTKKPRKVTPFTSESKGSPEGTMCSDEGATNRYREDGAEEERHSDIYTKAPQRYCLQTSPRKSSTNATSRRSSAPDTHASVLPLSPPSLMSPPLEKSLFFTSPLSSNVSLTSCMNTLATSRSPPLPHAVGSHELSLFPLPSNKTKTPKKLRTKRPEPPLPYPSYPDHVHTRTTARERSASAGVKQRSVSPGSPKPKGRSTSATYRENTAGVWLLGALSQTSLAAVLASSSSPDMLHKVNDIVAQGYTKKGSSVGGQDDSAPARSF